METVQHSSSLRSATAAVASLLIGLSVACVGASPAWKPRSISSAQPIFGDVAIRGLVFRDERVASRTTEVGYGVGSATAYGPGGTASATGSATVVGSSVTLESFDNYELLRALQLTLEDSGLVRRITPEARWAIDGVLVRVEPDTGAGRILWNVVNAGSLLMLLGGPFLGSAEAEVQLRVYRDGELLHKTNGVGRGNWWAIYGLVQTIPEGRRRAQIAAAHLALRDAVAQLAQNPPKLDEVPASP